MTAAGRVSEELYSQDISNGAAGDIKQMTRLARKMVCEWGMSDTLGMVEYGEHEDYVFLGRDINSIPGLQRVHRSGDRSRSAQAGRRCL